MRAYTVHEPPNPPASRLERGERLVFVREGFSWGAALFGPLWFLLHRMWLVLLVVVVLQLGLEGALSRLGTAPHWIVAAMIGLQVIIGFEAGALRRWTLARKGWRMLGAVTGETALDSERRFFEGWLAEPPAVASGPGAVSTEAPEAGERPPLRQRFLGAPT